MSYKQIAVAYDGSNLSKQALQHAARLAQAFNSKLTVIHAYATPMLNAGDMLLTAPSNWTQEYVDYAYKQIDSAKTLVPAGIDADFQTVEGYAAQVILDCAERAGADLIVMGSRGLGAIREFVLGSVSHNVAQHAKIPVLIVK
ncbi:universal stress protein [Cohnella lubricantis]|nr:universal stress protein [Cohnella lubricantis]MBP2118654.1 nucleotide-binding universal stress UspA family protein [Cohnella lubricantis]